MRMSNMLSQLGYAEDLDSAHWVDEPDNVLPEDFYGDEVETNTKYWRTRTNDYIYDSLDAISDFLLSRDHEERECSLHTLITVYGAELITFDSYGYTHGARRDR